MSLPFLPKTDTDVVDTIKWAAAEDVPLDVRGTGTKLGFGRPVQAAHILDLSALTGIINYEPAELIMTLRPGTPMSEIFKALNAANQMLAFDPMDLGPLYGQAAGLGTIGGVMSTNLSGPRRLTKGAARDHILGVQAVSGRGERFKAGGYVVKNVTGYDLCKGLTGAFGTLGVMTEITVKTVPRPETETSLVLLGLDEERAMQAMSAALGSAHEVSAASHLPADVTLGGSQTPATLLRLEGIGVSVEARAAALADALLTFGRAAVVEDVQSHDLWRQIKDVMPLAGREGTVWKLSVPPMSGAKVLARIKRALPGSLGYFDWAGGLIWLLIGDGGPADDAGSAAIRAALADESGGHATLMRASAATRASVPVFQPQEPALAALAKRVKAQFDPKGILNPGRMVVGTAASF